MPTLAPLSRVRVAPSFILLNPDVILTLAWLSINYERFLSLIVFLFHPFFCTSPVSFSAITGAICLGAMHSDHRACVLLSCSHSFHAPCLEALEMFGCGYVELTKSIPYYFYCIIILLLLLLLLQAYIIFDADVRNFDDVVRCHRSRPTCPVCRAHYSKRSLPPGSSSSASHRSKGIC